MLLQFILRELLHSSDYLMEGPPFQLAPFDWAHKQGALDKLKEHAQLLPHAFPDLAKEAAEFASNLHSPCVELIARLEPFIRAAKTSENLLYFLLKHQKSPTIKLMLDKICPQGLDQLKEEIILRYQKRGFYSAK
ncbi:MAG TPA: hypothetical protein VHK67_04420 [Rhabdochlamydiaceae bacterium]|nr:hypothetical protein [Rhabdochlamydiaceae bacterium]